MADIRRVEVWDLDACGWKEIQFKDLKNGDAFRMFEPTGEQVIGEGGLDIFVVVGSPYINADGNETVQIFWPNKEN
jgi:hypothetical protein